ncbi:hypothetical protein AAFF_G00098400 [Aldrovandia affinis]|uniref:Uncharacterized protein n=1 Tax=Aldrovandia affinis TaxID=143900 RepID=A0AAD7RVD2_9TELE|nr:hypothetical protein AAFF_G00098400 [Aldrovandia affinis]
MPHQCPQSDGEEEAVTWKTLPGGLAFQIVLGLLHSQQEVEMGMWDGKPHCGPVPQGFTHGKFWSLSKAKASIRAQELFKEDGAVSMVSTHHLCCSSESSVLEFRPALSSCLQAIGGPTSHRSGVQTEPQGFLVTGQSDSLAALTTTEPIG